MLRMITLVCFLLCMSTFDIVAQNFQVQIDSYPDSVSISEFVKHGFTTAFVKIDQNGIHRYFAGAYSTREEAEEIQRQLFLKGFESAKIIDTEVQRALCGEPCPFVAYTEDPSQTMTVKNIYFDFNKSDLGMESRAELVNILKILKNNPNSKLKILAYTDAKGTPGYNIELGKSRGRSARNFLIERGIHADRMHIKVFAELDPQKPNNEIDGKDSPAGRRWNRRVVLAIIDEEGKILTDLTEKR